MNASAKQLKLGDKVLGDGGDFRSQMHGEHPRTLTAIAESMDSYHRCMGDSTLVITACLLGNVADGPVSTSSPSACRVIIRYAGVPYNKKQIGELGGRFFCTEACLIAQNRKTVGFSERGRRNTVDCPGQPSVGRI